MQEKPEEMFVGLVAQKVIIERDGEILFVRSDQNSGKWDLPGGRLHLNEEPEEGILREVEEELGIRCELNGVVCTNQIFHASAQQQCFFVMYKATIPADAEIRIPADELAAYEWLRYSDCNIETVYENCLKALKVYFNEKA